MAIFSLPPLPSLSHTLTPSPSPCCLATVLINVIPLVCDWLKRRQIRVEAGAKEEGDTHVSLSHTHTHTQKAQTYKYNETVFLEHKPH